MSAPLILECYNTGTQRTNLIVFQCIASFFYKYIPMIFAKTLKFVSTVMSAVCFLSVTAQTVRIKAPDFAYPQTVSEDARKNLDKALREDNPREVLHSLIDYTLARSSTDAANVPGCISLIDSVRHVSRNDVLPGMLSMLEAVIYNNVYTSARWKYDARTSLPQSPLPADYTEWSGEQFRHRITELIGCALADSVALRSVPLKAYDGVVTQDRMTSVYYPTLYNFVARQAIDIMQGFGGMVRPALMRR